LSPPLEALLSDQEEKGDLPSPSTKLVAGAVLMAFR